jgi:hypothetical protein
MARLTRSPFVLGVLGLLVLAGWAAWSAGIFDSAIAQHVRSSSVYVAPGIDLDEHAAAKVIGNRRLVVIFLDKDADLADACHETKDAAYGTLVMLFQPKGDELTHYGCAQIPGAADENFGKAFVAETTAAEGADQFPDRPIEAVKVLAVNYDGLVKAGILSDGARTIEPSAPRYLLAGAAVLAVIGGAIAVYVVGRRLGRFAAQHQAKDETISDARASLNAKAAVVARQIIDLDSHTDKDDYRQLAADYADLAADLAADDPDPKLAARVESLAARARQLSRTAARAGSRRRSKPKP